MIRPADMIQVYQSGRASGQVLRLDESISFWGGFDPQTGTIIDQAHPQVGEVVAGKILVLPYAKGSAGTPAAVAESIRNGSGPAAIFVADPDANLATGLRVAASLYNVATPGAQLQPDAYGQLHTGRFLNVAI